MLIFGFFILEIILDFAPEPFEMLIFAGGLVLLTVGARWLMKRGETRTPREEKEVSDSQRT